jgi:hypothetical protein
MSFSQGSRTRLSFLPEVTFGTTPAGNFTELPFTTHSLNLTKERVTGNDIQSDRMPRVDRHGNRNAAGDIVVDLRNGNYDALLESLMFNAWDASPSSAPDQLKVGTTLKSLSVEDYLSDIDQAKLFTGLVVSQASFSMQPNQMVTTTFSLIGKDMALSQNQKTVTAATINQPFDAYSGDFRIGDHDGALSALTAVTSIDFTINNNLNPTFVIGESTTPQLEFGRCEIEGTITAYIEDATLINRFLNEVETAFDVSVNDPSGLNEYKFFFPKVKINSADTPVENPQSRLVTLSFVALYDDSVGGEASNIVIYRPDSSV